MNRGNIFSSSIIIVLLFSIVACARDKKNHGDSAHGPVVAGGFYPDSKKTVEDTINNFLLNVSQESIKEHIVGLISPHAGYMYSGQVAAFGYKHLSAGDFDTVIIVAASHYAQFDGAALLKKSYWKTPLGVVEIDNKIADNIAAKDSKIRYYEEPYLKEHSIEVQIPFLQMILKNFKIVPIIIGNYDAQYCRILAQSIVDSIPENKKVLLIASTDLSHYYVYGRACLMDGLAIDSIKNYDINGLIKHVDKGDCQLCGMPAVITVMEACKTLGAKEIKILKYANSGDVTGDKARVVGYASAVITMPETNQETGHKKENISADCKGKGENDKMLLNEKEKEKLLKLARVTLESYLTTKKKPDFKIEDDILQEKRGAFVTLHKNKELRGCIGNMVGVKPLWQTIRDMAIEAATGDSRFPDVTKEELSDIEIEISVLTPLEKVKDVNEIIMGKHGVIVKKGFRQGVFLPQVADETGWSRDEFLSALCAHKAGLSPDAWKDKDTELYIFSAQVFSEGNK